MADTGWILPGTGATDPRQGADASSGVPSSWSVPANALSNNGAFSTSSGNNDGTALLKLTNFGFSIPSTARIDGVEFRFNRRTQNNTGNENDQYVMLIMAGNPAGDNKASLTSWPTTATLSSSYGDSTDTWGCPLLPADVNDSNFGVCISAKASTSTTKLSEVDYGEMKVYYTDFAYDTMAEASSSAGTNDGSFGSAAWGGGSAITSSNDTRSTVSTDSSTDISQYLKCLNYGFSIPAGATILGISVIIEGKSQTASGSTNLFDNRIRLVKGGTIQSTDKAKPERWFKSTSGGDSLRIYGSGSDLWSGSWTPSDINSSTFGVVIAVKTDTATNLTAGIDHVRIRVFYKTFVKGSASLTGSEALAGSVNRIVHASSNSTGAATLEASAKRLQLASSAITASSLLTATPGGTIRATSNLTGSGALSSVGRKILHGIASITGNALLSALVKTRGTAFLTGSSTLIASGYTKVIEIYDGPTPSTFYLDWVCPEGVNSVFIELWGQGGQGGVSDPDEDTGSGGGGGGGGGGSGSYVNFLDTGLIPGKTYQLSPGYTDYTTPIFSTQAVWIGETANAEAFRGGHASGSTGGIASPGGAGDFIRFGSSGGGGTSLNGGGGAGSPGLDGGGGNGVNGGAGGSAGAGGGAVGGAGGVGSGNGGDGSIPGAGAGGGGRNGVAGAVGYGRVRLTYQITTIKASCILTASCSLSATGKRKRHASASITGSSLLSAIGSRRLQGVTLLSGSGTLFSIGKRLFHGIGSLTGTGTLSTSPRLLKKAQIVLTASASLSATAQEGSLITGTAILSSSSTFNAHGQRIIHVDITLTGTSNLTGTTGLLLRFSATLSAQGNLTAIGAFLITGSSNLTTVGILLSVAHLIRSLQAQLDGQATLTATPHRLVLGGAVLQGESNLQANGQAIVHASATLSATATLLASAQGMVSAQATLIGSGLLNANGHAIYSASVFLAAFASLTANAYQILHAVVSLSAVSSTSSTGRIIQKASVGLSGSSVISASGTLIKNGNSQFEAQGSLEATASVTRSVHAVLQGSGTLSEKASSIVHARATLSSSVELHATVQRITRTGVVLTAIANLTISLQQTVKGNATLLGKGTLLALFPPTRLKPYRVLTRETYLVGTSQKVIGRKQV
jgi:hypothetical protein